ncbi:MAG: hypothetical protein J7L03_06565 [Caldisericaceae bacterium]|nr:hypothetical protein [Caldisericaceae bacterium]
MRTQLSFTIRVHIIKQSKELNDEDFGITIKEGKNSTIIVKMTGEFYETLWHEFAHATQELIGNKFEDEELPTKIEDFIRNYLRSRKNS